MLQRGLKIKNKYKESTQKLAKDESSSCKSCRNKTWNLHLFSAFDWEKKKNAGKPWCVVRGNADDKDKYLVSILIPMIRS